jgi:hypothetical protein
MQIPISMRGHWIGTINDVNRKNSYQGEIFLNENAVSTTYHMSHGVKTGRLTFLCESDGFVILKEREVGKWNGTLVFYLGADEKLHCHWREQGRGFSASAIMERAILSGR